MFLLLPVNQSSACELDLYVGKCAQPTNNLFFGRVAIRENCYWHCNYFGMNFPTSSTKVKLLSVYKNKPRTTSFITGPTRLAAMFITTHQYSPESLILTRSIIKSFFERKRTRPPDPSKGDGWSILYHVMLGRGVPYGGLHCRVTVMLRVTAWYD